ncbi:extracellular protein [Cryptosporidium bovis]|uniref:extracellular protein n=1 Tax=Cryptosporidium bovis TaxID=310047 RepID=UPI00351A5DA2|nr:extracellular protein [Cryptosporidium bovis]
MENTIIRFLLLIFVCVGVTHSQDSVIPTNPENFQLPLDIPQDFYYNVDDSTMNNTVLNVTVEITSGEDLEEDSSEAWNLHINNGETLQENEANYNGRVTSNPTNIAKNIPDIRAAMLNCINQIRSVEGEKAADMNMLAWDYTIEGYAANTAHRICSTGVVSSSPSSWPYKGGDGELIATSPKLSDADPRTVLDKVCDLVQQWNNTSSFLPKHADFSNTYKWDIGESFKLAEPYLQLVLSKTTLIGCSFQTNCHENVGTIVVCQFSDKPDPETPPYAHIYKSLNLTEPQRQPCGRCGLGAKCCFQNMCIGRDIGSSCPKCIFSEPIDVNNDDISLCLDKYYQTCANSNCPEACINKHQIPSEILINQCLCTSKQLIEDMLLFDQLPTDPQMSYTEGWKRKKVYQHGLCRNIKVETQKVEIPDVGSNNEEIIENDTLGVVPFSSETIRSSIVNALNSIRSSQPAADMAMLMYDFNLEGYSRLRAKQICEADDKLVEFLGVNGTYPPYIKWPYRGGPGETIFVYNETVSIPDDVDNQELSNIQLGIKNPIELIEEAIDNWYSEGKTFDFHNLTNNIGKDFYNYRMVVRAEATAVGCSIVTNCKSKDIKTIFVCQYNYPNFKEPVHIKESILRRKLLDLKYLEFDVPYLHIEADPFLLLQQRRPCGRCRRGSTCCENNLCVGIDISQSSVTFVPPILENHQTGGCRSAFVRHCSQLNCQVNCLNPSSAYLAHQCFCVSPENMNKIAFANPDALELNNTLIEEVIESDSFNNNTRMLLIDGVSTPHPIATYGYIFGLINSHGLCLKLPGYTEDYGNILMDSIEANITANSDRIEFSVDSDNETLLSDVFIDLPGDDSLSQKDLTDKFRQEFLLAINSFRSIVGEFATNMNKLAYDFTLEGVAKSSAKQCQIASLNRYFEINRVPPLTYLSPANETLLPNNVASIVANWAKPLVSTTGSIDTSTFLETLNKLGSLPHSTKQLFSAHATSVGCSIFSNCPEGRYFVVCQFNHLDDSIHPFKPIEDGLSVSKSPCSCCGSEATCCENNLCVGGNSVGQDFSVCNDISTRKNENGRLCSKEFYKNCKDLNCKGQCLKPLDETDPFFEHYIFNQCTCSKKNSKSSPQAGLLEDGKALIRGICTSVNTTRLDNPGLLITHENLLDLELFTNGRNGNTISQALSSALQGELKGKLTTLDSRPLLYALNKQRSRVGEKGANINMLKWDYSLEGYSQNWAMVCLAGFNNNSPQEYPYRGGESEVVYSAEIGEEYDEFTSPLKIVESWFSGEEVYERNNGTVTITPRILNFLTVSQASSTSVGCSVVKGCPNSGFVVVCQFDSGVNLNKYPYLKISTDDSTVLPPSQAHPCGKCFSGSTCCNANLCVGLSQNMNRFATPLITKLSPKDNCIPSISRKCSSGICPEGCVPQITASESEKIPLYNKDNTIQFSVNQCQCTPKDFNGPPTEAWKIGMVRKNGQCEKVKGYNIEVARTQNHYIKVVTNSTEGEHKTVIEKKPEEDDYFKHKFSRKCIEQARINGLLPKCIVNPMNCTLKTLCYSYPDRQNCFCDGNYPKQCEALKLCRKELTDIIKSVKPDCIGKNILSEKCPCSKNIFDLECSCSAYPNNPGCPCHKNPNSLICQDLMRNSEASQHKVSTALSEISRVSKTLRG